MSDPKVSVIVPCYNHGHFLTQRLESILSQTFQDFELLLLDDASTDNSRDIIQDYSNHERVAKVVINDRNSGSPFLQWQKGIDLAQGEFIWIAESDDYCDFRFLQQCVQPMLEDDQIVVSYSQSKEVDESGNQIGLITDHFDDTLASRYQNSFTNEGTHEIATGLFYRCTIPNASAVVFRRTAFDKISPDFQSFNYCGDWHAWVDILQYGKIHFNAEPLNSFRTHKESTRVFQDLDRLSKRLNEELRILGFIDESNGSHPNMKKRFADLFDQYLACHTVSTVFSMLFNRQEKFPGRNNPRIVSYLFKKVIGKLRFKTAKR